MSTRVWLVCGYCWLFGAWLLTCFWLGFWLEGWLGCAWLIRTARDWSVVRLCLEVVEQSIRLQAVRVCCVYNPDLADWLSVWLSLPCPRGRSVQYRSIPARDIVAIPRGKLSYAHIVIPYYGWGIVRVATHGRLLTSYSWFPRPLILRCPCQAHAPSHPS